MSFDEIVVKKVWIDLGDPVHEFGDEELTILIEKGMDSLLEDLAKQGEVWTGCHRDAEPIRKAIKIVEGLPTLEKVGYLRALILDFCLRVEARMGKPLETE